MITVIFFIAIVIGLPLLFIIIEKRSGKEYYISQTKRKQRYAYEIVIKLVSGEIRSFSLYSDLKYGKIEDLFRVARCVENTRSTINYMTGTTHTVIKKSSIAEMTMERRGDEYDGE